MAALLTPTAALPKLHGGRDYISYSAVSTLQACSLKYFFRYVLGLPEETVSAGLIFGSAVHAALAYHFEQLLVGYEPPDLDTLLEVFRDTWHARAGQEILFPEGDDIHTMGRLAERMLRTFQASSLARPQGPIVGVEEELRGQLIPGLPDLVARLDLVVDEGDVLKVTDFKTARASWSQEHVDDFAGQLLLYHELVKELAEGRPVRLEFAVLTKTKFPELARYPIDVDPRQMERAKKIVERAWRVIQSGNFLPSPSPLNCPTCPFRKPCQSWVG